MFFRIIRGDQIFYWYIWYYICHSLILKEVISPSVPKKLITTNAMFSGCSKNVTKVLANTNSNAIFANEGKNLTNAPKMVNLQKPTLLTPILVDNLKRLLKEADYDQFKRFILISGFTNGFPVHFESPPISSKAENHISANSNAEVVLWGASVTER